MIKDKYYIKNDMSLFWHGCYSQWRMNFFKWNDIEFNCCEQFMMFFKALVHKDLETAKSIMKEVMPNNQKSLGRKVKNFDINLWDYETSMAVVYVANFLKFEQDDELYEYLINDPARIIVEASPADIVWGIGLTKEDPLAWDIETWKGENRLGKCITDVRKYFLYNYLDDVRINHEYNINKVQTIFDESGYII
jgi:ribA/ribD-fused uncharacterized protein